MNTFQNTYALFILNTARKLTGRTQLAIVTMERIKGPKHRFV